MNYRPDKYGNQISILGYGCMRFPQTLGKINVPETEKQLLHAIENGVNYFDTAYIYPGSEAVFGEIIARNNVRGKIYIATKLPHYLVRSAEKMEKIFQEQLLRLKTDRIDYYLIHMLSDIAIWDRLRELGIEQWIDEKKKAGKIGQIGFSYHGNSDMFCRIIDAYDWEFCQIQYNYMDEHSQAGRKGLDYAYSKGIPVFIMEPLRGGKLVNRLPAEAKNIFKFAPQNYTPAQWAFRWLWEQEKVCCVLSGMNSIEMINENISTASDVKIGEFGTSEKELLKKVVETLNANIKVGCTGCGYCMPCPKNVDIPGTFAAYNRRHSEGKLNGLIDYAVCTAVRKNKTCASNCVQCGVCETHCPQKIPIRQELMNAKKAFEGPIFKFISKIIKLFV